MRITGNRIRRAFENVTPDVLNTAFSHDLPEKGVVVPMNKKKNFIPFVLQKIAVGAAMIALLIGIGTVAWMILNSRKNPPLNDNPTEASTSPITILPMQESNGAVDKAMIDGYLMNCTDFNYGTIKNNDPDILTNLKNVTPDLLKNKCSIYRFTYSTTSSLGGETFLIYDGNVYQLGSAWGGFGITEFAYECHDRKDMLYFIYSSGSGIHRSHIGLFDFNTKQILDYTDTTDVFMYNDIKFHLSEDNSTLGISRAQILWSNMNCIEIKIAKEEVLLEDISVFDFSVIKSTCIFNTENIYRITFYTYYGTEKIADVPAEDLTEIKIWLGSFVLGEEAPELLPPGTDTIHVEIEYVDGTVIKQGMTTATVNGITYYINSNTAPDCYKEILSKADSE